MISLSGLMILASLLLFVVLPLAAIVWLISRGLRSTGPSGKNTAAARLAELEALRRDGRITEEEYERQRASIISQV